MNPAKLLYILIILCLAFWFSCTGSSIQSCPRIGDKAPDFTLPGLEGKNVSLSDFTGKPVIINTWSISCIECKKEMPFFKQIQTEYADKGLVILSINTMDSASTAREFLNQNGYRFTVALDLKNEIYKKYCCPKKADPNTFFISRDGIIRSIKIGGFASQDDLELELKKIID